MDAGSGALGIGGGSLLTTALPFIVIMAAMYLLMILPQKRKEKKKKAMINAVKKGDEIVSIGGISGKVLNVKDDEVTVEGRPMATGNGLSAIFAYSGMIRHVVNLTDKT